MTCSKLDDSVINGSGYAATTVRLERGAVDFSCPFAADNCHLLQLTSDVVVTNIT